MAGEHGPGGTGPRTRGAAGPGVPRRKSRRPAGVYSWLEEIPFRTAVAVLACVFAILGSVLAALIVAPGGRPPARPSALPGGRGQVTVPERPHTVRPPARDASTRGTGPAAPSAGTAPAGQGGGTGQHPAPGRTGSVTAHALSLRLTAGPDPANVGQYVALSAVLSPPSAGGSVTFTDNGRTIPACASMPVPATGVARCHVSYGRASTHVIAVSYRPPSGRAGLAAAVGETIASCGASYRGCNLQNADLAGADLRGADLAGADLQGADLAGADLAGATLSGTNLTGADLATAMLARANLSGSNLQRAGLQNADLVGASLAGANLGGVTWLNTICPDGTNSDGDQQTCQHDL